MPEVGISVIVPTYNEENNIKPLISRLAAALSQTGSNYEILVIDDYSTDATVAKAQAMTRQFSVRVWLKSGIKGKAFSILEGARRAKFDIIAIIDADLQYPPEAIPAMAAKVKEGADVVVASRRHHREGRLRQVLSRSFTFVFCRWLHGLDFDVQSGLKIFRKEVIGRARLHPTPWTFDLEFLLQTRASGYKILSQDIDFARRLNGKSKISLLKSSWEIGWSAIKLKLRPSEPVPFSAAMKRRLGDGFHYRGSRYVSHTELRPSGSAFRQLNTAQQLFITVLIVLAGIFFYLNWHLTLTILIGVFTYIYVADLIFNAVVIDSSLRSAAEIKLTKGQFKALKRKDLPRYTILCPLYKEWQVLPQFVRAIDRLDYPKSRLQVLLLLEEDDVETRRRVEKMKLPGYFQTLAVPQSLPRTKPKACNYGLSRASGELIVIYDAEDIPEKRQLKKAVAAFAFLPDEVVCLQAKLNYFNPHQNLLTKLFTAEYSLWFDLILSGLQTIDAPIPLGGTSNHFKTKALKTLQGWDAFNVTEDADLGMRLYKYGYKTRMIDSTTYEEANSRFGNWVSQRTRWIKGYIQTYLVHMRRPGKLMRQVGFINWLNFQLIIGGKIFTILVNPLMWMITYLYFLSRTSVLGKFIESFFPAAIFYFGVIAFVAGNFLYLYSYMIGALKRQHYSIVKYAFLVPGYWLMMSLAAWRAVVELAFRPHHWAKTKHGFYLYQSA